MLTICTHSVHKLHSTCMKSNIKYLKMRLEEDVDNAYYALGVIRMNMDACISMHHHASGGYVRYACLPACLPACWLGSYSECFPFLKHSASEAWVAVYA